MAERPPVDEQLTPLRGLGRFPRSKAPQVRRLQDPSFPIALRGYDRATVDSYVEEVSRVLAELEARQSSEAVIQRALEDVGEQTSAILKKAHETAEEVTQRSRAQADDRLQEAIREGERVRREADAWLASVQAEVETLFGERRRLIEEMRTLSEELLGVADSALDRLEEDEAAAQGSQETLEVELEAGGADGAGAELEEPGLDEAVEDEGDVEPVDSADAEPEASRNGGDAEPRGGASA